MKKNRSYYLTISAGFLFLSLLVTGCQTRTGIGENNYPGIIAEEGTLLIHFNLAEDRVVLDRFLGRYSTEDLSDIISRTDFLTVSTRGSGLESEFSVVAEGNYPKLLTNIAIGRQENWEKHREKYIWWENRSEGLYTSVPTSSIALFSNRELKSELESVDSGERYYIPDYVRMEFNISAVTVYSRLPGPELYSAVNIPEDKMSIKELFLTVNRSDSKYEISGILQFSNESQARIFSTALKLGLLMKLRETGRNNVIEVIRKSRIEASGTRIIIEGVVMNAEDFLGIMDGDTGAPAGN